MKVIAYDVYQNPDLKDFVEYVSLDELLAKSDLISLTAPSGQHLPYDKSGEHKKDEGRRDTVQHFTRHPYRYFRTDRGNTTEQIPGNRTGCIRRGSRKCLRGQVRRDNGPLCDSQTPVLPECHDDIPPGFLHHGSAGGDSRDHTAEYGGRYERGKDGE